MTAILSTALGGALQRRPDGWYWRDGTPEPRVRDMLLNDIAPNFRVLMSGPQKARTSLVEIPHGWRNARHWPKGRVDTQAAAAIARLIDDVGAPSSIYADGLAEALDEPRGRIHGHTVPVAHWDAAMRAPCGAWWDSEHEADILAGRDRLQADMGAAIRDIGTELYGDQWQDQMARLLNLRKDVVKDWARGKRAPTAGDLASLHRVLDTGLATLTGLRGEPRRTNDNVRNQVIREAIASYESDPPDTRYQLGYLDALLDIAERECGIAATDPLMVAGRKISAAAHNPPEPPPRAKLIIIDGGKQDDGPPR